MITTLEPKLYATVFNFTGTDVVVATWFFETPSGGKEEIAVVSEVDIDDEWYLARSVVNCVLNHKGVIWRHFPDTHYVMMFNEKGEPVVYKKGSVPYYDIQHILNSIVASGFTTQEA